MTGFHKLLLAIDLSPASTSLIRRVVQMYPEDLEKVHVVHVIESILGAGLNLEIPNSRDPDVLREMHSTNRKVQELLQLSGLQCPDDKIHLAFGQPSFQIKRLARELGADLVVVGSHCREDDWMHLPGATTNCVIQGISTDVMAIKV